MTSPLHTHTLSQAAQFERLQRIPASQITAAQLFQLQLYEVAEPLKKEANLLDAELSKALEASDAPPPLSTHFVFG